MEHKKNTIAQLILSEDFEDLEQNGSSIYRRDGKITYLVVTEAEEEFKYYLKFFDMEKEDLPTVKNKYFRREFLLKNVDIIKEVYSKKLKISDYDYERISQRDKLILKNNILEYQDYLDDLDAEFEKGEYAYHYSYLEDFINETKIGTIQYPSIETFEGYPEEAFEEKEVRAFVFRCFERTKMPAYCFGPFDFDCPNEESLNRIFLLNDIWDYFNEVDYDEGWSEEIEAILEKYSPSYDDVEPTVVFAFE